VSSKWMSNMGKFRNIVSTALRFVRYDRAKSIGVLVGIVISTFLIGQQIGIATFLTGLMSALVDNANADVWVIDNQAKDVNQIGLIDMKKVRDVQSIPGVMSADPLLVAGARATFSDGSNAAISLIGSTSPTFSAGPSPDKIALGKVTDLLRDGAVTADFYDRVNFGGSADVGTSFEINGKRAMIAAQTKGARGFGGIIMFTTLERARFYANVSENSISAVLVKIKPGANADSVVNAINRTVYGIRAWKAQDLKNSTVNTILATSGIGASTGSLIVFAIVAGFFIIGLTMFSAALDRLKDYGTLKAIGASNGYIRSVILGQAFSFALTGFSLAFFLLTGFQKGVEASGLVFEFSPVVIIGLLSVTLFISLFGAVFAIRRISGVEPASVFRG
jgi:putative ABC transport system permease protein